jgi:hypothetical protein
MKKYIMDNEICGGSMAKMMGKYGIFVKELSTKGKDGKVVESMENGYTFLFYATKSMSYGNFLKFFKDAGYPVFKERKDGQEELAKNRNKYYMTATPEEQYLISTGKRYFKGYTEYDQILRMIFDLETTGLRTKEDKIEQIGVRFNRPVKYKGKEYTFERIFTVEGETEEERAASELDCIEKFVMCIALFQPDVITAHNGETLTGICLLVLVRDSVPVLLTSLKSILTVKLSLRARKRPFLNLVVRLKDISQPLFRTRLSLIAYMQFVVLRLLIQTCRRLTLSMQLSMLSWSSLIVYMFLATRFLRFGI